MNISRDKGRVRNLVKRPESRADGYRALRAMSFIKQVRTYFQPPVSEVVLGMVIDIKVVTDEPGYDFRILVHHMTKDENIVSKHYVFIAANGQTMDDVKRDIFGKFILLAVDEHGHGTPPEKGRLQWNSERWAAKQRYGYSSLKRMNSLFRLMGSLTKDFFPIFF